MKNQLDSNNDAHLKRTPFDPTPFFILGLVFVCLGIVGFLAKGIPLTSNDVIVCLVIAVLTFLMFAFIAASIIILLINPIVGGIFAIVFIMIPLYYHPLVAIGMGISLIGMGIVSIIPHRKR